MIYPEDKNSTIDLAVRSLERSYRLKKDEHKSNESHQDLFIGSELFVQPMNALSTSLGQIRDVLAESAEVCKLVSNKIQQEIKEDPWAVLAKVAIGSYGLGLIAARRLALRSKVKE